ncbi:hypothetical protein [Lutibacter sp.]|uniref:hypothetical protein n=1 Tax=Lutibacter sp. TaxID=1925666 RepID=UPI00356A3D7A
MTNFRKSVPAPTTVGAGAPTPKKGLVTIIHSNDVLAFPLRDANGVKMLGNIVLLAGAKMHQLYLTSSSQKGSHEIEGEEDMEGFVKKFEGTHPGDSLEVNEFVQNALGEGFIVIYGIGCGNSQGKVLGSPCNPMKLKGSYLDDKDGRKHTLMFEQTYKDTYIAGFYDGAITLGANYDAPTADIAMTVANGMVYKVPSLDTTDAITAASIDQPHLAVISLVGGGGTDPATLSSGAQGAVTVILKDDTTWTALENAIISLQVFKAGATTYLIEQSRS